MLFTRFSIAAGTKDVAIVMQVKRTRAFGQKSETHIFLKSSHLSHPYLFQNIKTHLAFGQTSETHLFFKTLKHTMHQTKPYHVHRCLFQNIKTHPLSNQAIFLTHIFVKTSKHTMCTKPSNILFTRTAVSKMFSQM